MIDSKLKTLKLIKQMEEETERCVFKWLEKESDIKGNNLADIVSSLFSNGHIRIDNGDENNLDRAEYRDIIRLWMTPRGIDALLESI